jgi:hypothetical protein
MCETPTMGGRAGISRAKNDAGVTSSNKAEDRRKNGITFRCYYIPGRMAAAKILQVFML